MKQLLLFCAFTLTCAAQVVWTAPVLPQGAVPGKMTVSDTTSTGPSAACTVTGNAVPATSLSFACTVAGVTVPNFSMPFPAGSTYTLTYALNAGANGNAITIMLTGLASGGVQAQASIHGAPPVTQGTF